jgi:cobalt-zinc-cadmium efflux system membrane fusion protein
MMPIAVVIVTGAVLGALILTWDKGDKAAPPGAASESHAGGHSSITLEEHAGHEQAQQPDRGPHGGKLFTQSGFGVAVTIFEQGVPQQVRLYLYEN